MKKMLLMIACIVFCLMETQAKNNESLTNTEKQVMVSQEVTVSQQTENDTIITFSQLQNAVGHVVRICANKYDRALVYAPEGCNDFVWAIGDEAIYNVSPVILNKNQSNHFSCWFYGCGHDFGFDVYFIDPNVPTETTEEIWIHSGELAELSAVGSDSASMYSIRWNTGEEENVIYKPAGTYIAGISDMCATAYRTKIVKESVEIDLATCDLESNLNMVTWPTTEAQAQYIDHVIVKRDGLQVGTANYSDGQFIDNIGSDAASRTYTLTAIATDGTECPIVSYPKETIHMSYTLGMNNTIEIGWNTPTGYDLLGYNVCEWHENDGSLNVIDYVGASVTSYTCSQSQFDQGYIVVQGVEAGKDGETRLLSNRSMDLVGLGENEATTFKVYPNPAKDRFTIEGTGTLTVTNTLGQTVLTREIDGKATMELPQGLYFVKLCGVTRKVVVE